MYHLWVFLVSWDLDSDADVPITDCFEHCREIDTDKWQVIRATALRSDEVIMQNYGNCPQPCLSLWTPKSLSFSLPRMASHPKPWSHRPKETNLVFHWFDCDSVAGIVFFCLWFGWIEMALCPLSEDWSILGWWGLIELPMLCVSISRATRTSH